MDTGGAIERAEMEKATNQLETRFDRPAVDRRLNRQRRGRPQEAAAAMYSTRPEGAP
jgi:hypothetical protein